MCPSQKYFDRISLLFIDYMEKDYYSRNRKYLCISEDRDIALGM